MDDFEVIPIDEEGPSIIDELPTEDTDEEPVIDDIQDDPSVPEGGEPESTEEAPEPKPDLLMYASEVDELPTEDTDEEPVIDDEPDGGEQPYEPDINPNITGIPIIGSAREGDVIPVLMRSGAPLGISPVGWGDRMQSDVDLTSQAATEAKAVAQATGQHFWEDDNGAHVTEITKDDWKAEEAKETPFADVSDAKPYHNLLMNSLGILLRTALKNLVSITRSAIAFFDGRGNDAANVTASFGKDGFQVGTVGKSHMTGDYHSLQLIDKANKAYLHVSDLRDTTGYALISERFCGDGNTLAFRAQYEIHDVVSVYISTGSIGYTVSNNWAFVFDSAPPDGSIAYVQYHTASTMTKAFTFGSRKPNTTVGGMSYAEGHNVTASGLCTHAEGYEAVANGGYSHAEGYRSEANEMYSHAEGYLTTASGVGAHSEGGNTVASGSYSHAGGDDSIASGLYSFVHGLGLKAVKPFQAVFGQYNKEDPSTSGSPGYLLILGNGTSDSDRSNALTVDWGGAVNTSGNVTVAPSSSLDTTAADNGITADAWATPNLCDKNNRFVGHTYGVATPAGLCELVARATNNVNGSNVTNDLRLRVAKDGTRSVAVSDANIWRTAIGLGNSAVQTFPSTEVSLANNAKVNLCSVSLAAGVWLVTAGAVFNANSAGDRLIHVTTTSEDAGVERTRSTRQRACSAGTTSLSVTCLLNLTNATTAYLVGWQSSGATLGAKGGMYCWKIK